MLLSLPLLKRGEAIADGFPEVSAGLKNPRP